MDTNQILKKLKEFKGLPQYQFERRIDAFLYPYLETVFNEVFKVKDFIFVCPEFPMIRLDKDKKFLLDHDKRPVYADYLMFSKVIKTIFLVELKTDNDSLKKEQFDRYILNITQKGWKGLLSQYIWRTINTNDNKSKEKYFYGLNYIHRKAPLISGINEDSNFNEFTNNFTNEINEDYIANKLMILDEYQLKLIYLGPEGLKNNINKFCTKNEEALSYFFDKKYLITLKIFAEFVDDEQLKELLERIGKNED